MRFATPPSTRSPLTPPPERNKSFVGGGQVRPFFRNKQISEADAANETEMQEKKARGEEALHATRAVVMNVSDTASCNSAR
jgi:hypothetical protein